ncbi:MAG: hypothetical protein WB681_03255 [Candidatus Cybelea sp.]
MTGGSQATGIIVAMMTQQLEVSILAAPLAAIDRRVLPQAWYSALRLARETPRLSTARPHRGVVVGNPALRAFPKLILTANPPRVPVRWSHAASSTLLRVCGDEDWERVRDDRARRWPLARAIENAFSDPRAKVRRATFSMGRGSARIHIVLQTKGQRAALVALCRPELSGLVARALMQARLALAARGVDVELRAKGVQTCS